MHTYSNKICSWLPAIALLLCGCSSSIPNRDPQSQRFPQVRGENLAKEEIEIPKSFSGSPAILLIGFVQKAQFDIDRWILGLTQLETPAPIVELPTIEGMMPGLAAGFITEGMRKGIPSEEWPGVVTLFGDDAAKVVALFGNENPNNARVVLLNPQGEILWFHDRGYSAAKVSELDRTLRALR